MDIPEKHIILFFLLAGLSASAQRSTELEGRVYSKDGDVAGTHVLNITTQRATITDANGFFTIPVRLNDTLVFTAVQYKRKELEVGLTILKSKLLYIPLEEVLTELDEVVVRPYGLSGDLKQDTKTEAVITASTLGLPNSNVKLLMQSERLLKEAQDPWKIDRPFRIPINPIIYAITGRTKMLKKRVVRDQKYRLSQQIRNSYPDSIYIEQFKIPKHKIDDFIYFCEVDSLFDKTVETNEELKIWEFMRKKSVTYRKNNALE